MTRTYGLVHVRQDSPRPRDVITAPERTESGNVVLRTGRERPYRDIAEGWEQRGHVVLTRDEALSLIQDLQVATS